MSNFFIVELPKLNNTELVIKKDFIINLSPVGKETFKLIKDNPGIKVPNLLKLLKEKFLELNLDKIRYLLKTELKEYVELRGSKKTGGYYVK